MLRRYRAWFLAAAVLVAIVLLTALVHDFNLREEASAWLSNRPTIAAVLIALAYLFMVLYQFGGRGDSQYDAAPYPSFRSFSARRNRCARVFSSRFKISARIETSSAQGASVPGIGAPHPSRNTCRRPFFEAPGGVCVRTTGLDQSQAICNLYIIVLLGLGVRGMEHLNTVKSFGFQGSDILFVEGETTPVSWPG